MSEMGTEGLRPFDRDALPKGDDSPAAVGLSTGVDAVFDERYKLPFHGLAYLGALTNDFEWLGHKFIIRTLTADEELAVPLLIREWENTVGAQRAYVMAVAALCTVTIDDSALPTPIAEEPGYAWAFQKFNYAKARWFHYTFDKIYEQYLVMEDQVRKVLDELGKASGQAAQTPGWSESSDTSNDEDS
jgi:hypothetical protein